MAGAGGMVSNLTESGGQRHDHYPAVTVVAVPIRTTLFGGVTGSGADLFVAWMHSVGEGLVESVAITVIGANLVDKILTAIIVWVLLRQLPLRTTRHFPTMSAVR